MGLKKMAFKSTFPNQVTKMNVNMEGCPFSSLNYLVKNTFFLWYPTQDNQLTQFKLDESKVISYISMCVLRGNNKYIRSATSALLRMPILILCWI